MTMVLDARSAKIQFFDLAGKTLAEANISLESVSGPIGILDAGMASAPSLLSGANSEPPTLLAVGVALGPRAPALVWPQRYRHRPVVVDSSVAAAAAAETLSQTGPQPRTFFLDVGETIDCVVLLPELPESTRWTHVKEFGHTPINRAHDPQTKCPCGKTDCLQAVAGQDGIIAMLNQDSEKPSRSITAALRRADPLVMHAFRQAGRDIGYTLIGSIHLFRPEVISVRTQWTGATEPLLAGIKEAIYAGAAPVTTQNLLVTAPRRWSAAEGIGHRALRKGLEASEVDELIRSASELPR